MSSSKPVHVVPATEMFGSAVRHNIENQSTVLFVVKLVIVSD